MSQKKDILDDFLRSALADLEGDVSSSDWENIASRLDAQERRRIPIGWWWLTGALIVGLGIGLLTLPTNNSSETQSPQVNTEMPLDSDLQDLIQDSEPKDVIETPNQTDITTIPGIAKFPGIANGPEKNKAVGDKKVFETSDDNDKQYFEEFEPRPEHLGLQLRPVKGLIDIFTIPQYTSIFYASVIDVDEFNRIPTINKGSQKGPGSTWNKGSWELGLSASPALASKLIKPNGRYAGLLNKYYNNIASKDESDGISYQLGLNVNRHLLSWLYVSSGIQYNQLGESVDYDFKITHWPILNATETAIVGFANIQLPLREHVQYNGHNTYHYMEIPLKLGIVVPVLKRRMELRTEVGIQYSYLVGTSGKKIDVTYLELQELKAQQGYQRSNLGGVITSGLYLKTDNRLEWGFTPYYQMSLTSIRSKTAAIQERPYNYGFNIRLNYAILNRKQ